MRFAVTLLLIAASPSTVSVGCTPRSQRPDADDVTAIELHTWSMSRRQGPNYWVTRLDYDSGCISTELEDDGVVQAVHDCSLAEQVRPRIAELIAVFELDPNPRTAAETIGFGNGNGVVIVRGDGSRWTADAKLLREGGELLDRDIAEWMMLGPQASELPPTPEGWTQLRLTDGKGVFVRELDASGRWSCESWLVSEQSLEHRIVTTRGRVTPDRASELLDGFADGLPEADPKTNQWHATLARVEPSTIIELHGDELVGRWNAFATELDDACSL